MKKVIKNFAFLLAISMSAFFVSCSDDDDDVVVKLKTADNLKAAITGETGANAKYTAFARKAADDGLNNISVMFKAAAAAEAVHIKNHNRTLTGMGEAEFNPTPGAVEVKTTKENLASGIEGETYEFTEMYPAFLKDATNEENTAAEKTFNWAKDTEKIHADLYAMVLNLLNVQNNDSEVSGIWYVCPVCGNLHYSIDGVDVCEICGAPSGNFVIFE